MSSSEGTYHSFALLHSQLFHPTDVGGLFSPFKLLIPATFVHRSIREVQLVQFQHTFFESLSSKADRPRLYHELVHAQGSRSG